MAHREKMTRGKDRKVFHNTAAKTKAVNLTQKVMRGGTRF